MINYGLIREDKSQLNKNNTSLHAVGEGSFLNSKLHILFEQCVFKVTLNFQHLKVSFDY